MRHYPPAALTGRLLVGLLFGAAESVVKGVDTCIGTIDHNVNALVQALR